jgi:hypothetical protein
MDDGELFTWYSHACVVWARANGDADADMSSFLLRDPGSGVVAIAAWTSSAPQPTDVQLKAVGVPACAALKEQMRVMSYMQADYTIVTATQAVLDSIEAPPDGAIVMNSTIMALQVCIGGDWVTVTPPDPTMKFPVVAMGAVDASPVPAPAPVAASARARAR